jgi:hypothetical protein
MNLEEKKELAKRLAGITDTDAAVGGSGGDGAK